MVRKKDVGRTAGAKDSHYKPRPQPERPSCARPPASSSPSSTSHTGKGEGPRPSPDLELPDPRCRAYGRTGMHTRARRSTGTNTRRLAPCRSCRRGSVFQEMRPRTRSPTSSDGIPDPILPLLTPPRTSLARAAAGPRAVSTLRGRGGGKHQRGGTVHMPLR